MIIHKPKQNAILISLVHTSFIMLKTSQINGLHADARSQQKLFSWHLNLSRMIFINKWMKEFAIHEGLISFD